MPTVAPAHDDLLNPGQSAAPPRLICLGLPGYGPTPPEFPLTTIDRMKRSLRGVQSIAIAPKTKWLPDFPGLCIDTGVQLRNLESFTS
jgi:hypothetical protein